MIEDTYARITGFQYKSGGERKIAEFLGNYGLRFIYEQPLLVHDYGKPRIWYPDFTLPECATIIEYFGGVGNKDYDRGVSRKRKAYAGLYLDLVSMFPQSFEGDWQSRTIEKIGQGLDRRVQSFYEKTNMWTHRTGSYARNQRRRYVV